MITPATGMRTDTEYGYGSQSNGQMEVICSALAPSTTSATSMLTDIERGYSNTYLIGLLGLYRGPAIG